jgi:hypothetical protein
MATDAIAHSMGFACVSPLTEVSRKLWLFVPARIQA